MKTKRRNFLKNMSGLLFTSLEMEHIKKLDFSIMEKSNSNAKSIIGVYGAWASNLRGSALPSLSFRNKNFTDLKAWQKKAKNQTLSRMAAPNLGKIPKVNVIQKYEYDCLEIQKLTWQLPYGAPTEAILLKPIGQKGKLPGILALHDHGGNKYFGTEKITKTSDLQHHLMAEHQKEYYEGKAWANEIAKKGYVVLVSDTFTFASRRVNLNDVPEEFRKGISEADVDKDSFIEAYNNWAGEHEHVMAKSLFCGGTTWPGVFFAEDKMALDIFCAREDVDSQHVGCCGLSGGGLRTVYLAGLDERIKCAVPVGFMSTWNDFLLHKSFTHTWMTYVPLLPNELDFPEILGLRTPLPTLVLNDIDDQLYTIDEMKKADEILKAVYKKANAEANYQCNFHQGPHKFDQKMQKEAFDWFDKWLKK